MITQFKDILASKQYKWLNVHFSKHSLQETDKKDLSRRKKEENQRNKTLYKSNESGANLEDSQLYCMVKPCKPQYNLGMKLCFLLAYEIQISGITPMSSSHDPSYLSPRTCRMQDILKTDLQKANDSCCASLFSLLSPIRIFIL